MSSFPAPPTSRGRAGFLPVLLLAAIVVVVTACGGPPSSSKGESGISVEDALRMSGTEPVKVSAYVFAYGDGRVVLADSIAESFPPQPGDAVVDAQGVDLARLDMRHEGAVSWTDHHVSISGKVQDGQFVVTATASE